MKISIIEFSVENFKIFQKKTVFSMLTRKNKHTFDSNGENLLKTSLVYGPNASGKSTLLQGFLSMRSGVINSANNPEGSVLPYQPFLLSPKKNSPILFELIFSLDKKIFKYNFSFLKNEIVTENLFEILASGKEKNILIRKKQDIQVFADFEKSKDIKEKTRKEVLFLSATSQWNNELAMQIVKGLKDINIISGPDSDNYHEYTVKLFKNNEDKKRKILNFLKQADFCIEDGIVEKKEIPEGVRKQMHSAGAKDIPNEVDVIFFTHNKLDSKGNKKGSIKFNMGDESAGTQAFFDVLGPIVDTLDNGKVLLIDEFDNSLHPYLTKFIIDLFEKKNSNNAQLVVTTHDTSLLAHKELNKDQFWFTEKNKIGAGNLFSLAEFKTRNDTEFSKKYLEGRFGALPFIDFKD